MRPKDIVPELGTKKQDKLPDVAMWGLLLHCLDSYETHQDLRSIETKVVASAATWLENATKLLTPGEKDWCEGIAQQDAVQNGNCEMTGLWTRRYAIVTVVLRKLLTKQWKSPEFRQQLEAKRKDFETFISATYNADTDWTLTKVNSNTRYGTLEQTLSILENPNEQQS